MRYRRAFVPGASYFFTVVTARRQPLLALNEHVAWLRHAFQTVKITHPFKTRAIVILPDHLHCIWTLPEGDADFPTRWRLIKTRFTRQMRACYRDPLSAQTGKTLPIWQARYWEHLLRDEEDFRRHVEYIHFNPVKHGLTQTALDWPYSSFSRYVDAGLYSADWGQGGVPNLKGVGAE